MKRWTSFAKPYRKYFILGPMLMVVEVLGEVIMPKLLANLINAANNGTLTNWMSVSTMLKMVLTAVAMMAGGVSAAYFATKASVNYAADLRSSMYEKIQTYSFANIDKFSTGSLVTRLTNDVTQIQNFVNMLLRMAIRAPGMMVMALIMAISIKPKLSVVFAVSIPLLLLTILGLIKFGFPRFGILQSKVDALNSTVQESVTNIRVVKSFVREEHQIQVFGRANKDLKDAGLRAVNVLIFTAPVMTFFMNATTICVILLGGSIVLDGGMQVGDLSAFITYVTQILMSLLMVTIVFMAASRAIASAKRIGEVLDEEATISDKQAACPEKRVTEGSVRFCDVSFRYYKNSEEEVLSHVSLDIPAGALVGIIGSTGSGKTTLVSMIPHLYEPDSGKVLVDGVDVRDYSLKNLRDGVGMVLQKNTLFSGTVADNLRWGDAEASQEKLELISGWAQADGFVKGFTDGYETEIEQGGSNVSGGQKQRLCIARALLKHPKILILDDSTSAVDTATEAGIRESFRRELPDTTKIIIAQRISSVMDADMIVVLNDGRITGTGTHEELLACNEEYREIYESQTGVREGKTASRDGKADKSPSDGERR